MPKSLTDLLPHLRGGPDPAPPTTDVRQEVWYQFSEEITQLLATGHYEWAVETLMGIQETVERSHVVTEGQRKAVANIEAGRQRPQRGMSRRYENFSRRYQ